MFFVLVNLVVILTLRHVGSLHIQPAPPHTVSHRQPIPIGRPYDFDDVDRDAAATEDVGEHGAQVLLRDAPGSATSETHFFTDADCVIFTSEQTCAKARQFRTYLASYPCSGNTWARSLLEQTLLIYTGSVFPDKKLHELGMLGEGIDDPSRVFPIKTHWPVVGHHMEGEGITNLVIVREPLQAVLSWLTLRVVNHHNRELPKEQLQKAFNREAGDLLHLWANMARVVRNRTDAHVVRYEDIVGDTEGMYVSEIFPYLGVDPDSPGIRPRLRGAVERCNNAYNTTRRNHTYTFEFTDGHRYLAKRIIGDELASHYGYRFI